jgi:ubiquinone biosynthesis protein UbiJ
MATPVWLPGLEEAVNRFLALDPTVPERLSRLSGRVIGVTVEGLPAPLFLSLPGGAVHLTVESPGEPDVTLRGAPFSLLRLALAADGERLLLDGSVTAQGEVGVLTDLRRALSSFTVDWEEELARRVGDVPAHQIGNQARALGDWLARLRGTLALDLREYLWEEVRLVPRPEAVEEFLRDVDTLRDDVERLAKRVERLAKRIGGP